MSEQDIMARLDAVVETLETLQETLDEVVEGQAQITEAIANLSLPGSGYGIDTIDEL